MPRCSRQFRRNPTKKATCNLSQVAKVEDRGLEPLGDFDAKRNSDSTSSDRQQGSAARVLHSGGRNCHCLSSLDPDLQAVIAAWDRLPRAIQRAIVGLALSER
jgi:hypothetical protein